MRQLLIGLCLACAAAAAAAPLAPNVLPDPSFEGRSWSLVSWEYCEYRSEWVTEAHDGRTGAHLLAIKPGKDNRASALVISKPFAVEAGREYLLSLWYRTPEGAQSAAAVSVAAFGAPFASAQWKTPKTSYTTYSLPPSPTWRLFTQRCRVPADSVEGVVLPRVNGVGEAWFDDLSLTPADQVPVQLEVGGEIERLPDSRRYRGSLGLPAGAALRLEAYTATGRRLAAGPAGRELDLLLALPAGEAAQALVLDPASRSVYAAIALPAPPAVQFDLTYPRYRNTVYSTDGRDAVTGLLRLNVAPALLKRATYAARLEGPAKPRPGRKQAAAALVPVRVPLPATLPPGGYTLKLQVTLAEQEHELAREIRVVPPAPAPGHAFTVGSGNELLLDGRPFLARGFMGGKAEAYGPVAKAGYNVGMTFGDSLESATRLLDGCARLGMYVVTGLPNTYLGKHDQEGLRAAVRQLCSHPALLGYYFPDEPSPNQPGRTPQELRACYELMCQEDPYHPVLTTLCDPELADDYENCLDILCFDPYPVTKSPHSLTMVSDWMVRARELLSDRKPVWCVPQCFGGELIENCPPSYSWLTPSPAQERCMTYLAVATGARGLLYYCYHVVTKYDQAVKDKGGWPWLVGGYLPEKQPALWQTLATIGGELQRLGPALARPSRMWTQDGVFCREIMPAGPEPGYLIAVNPSAQKRVETVVRLQTRLPQLPELEEIHRSTCCVKVAGSQATISLDPLQVGLYLLPGGR